MWWHTTFSQFLSDVKILIIVVYVMSCIVRHLKILLNNAHYNSSNVNRSDFLNLVSWLFT